MGSEVQVAAQVAAHMVLIAGYALVLVLGIRFRVGRGLAQRLLAILLSLALVWIVALAVLGLLFAGKWWAWVWNRTAQMGLALMALVMADLAAAFVGRPGRRWPWWLLVGIFSLVAFALDSWFFAGFGNLSPFPAVVVGRIELGTVLLTLAWAACTAGAWWMAISALREAKGSKHRNRIRYLVAALVCFAVGDLLVLSGRAGGAVGIYVGFAARLLGLSVMAFAALRHDLPDVRRWSLVSLRVIVLAGVTALLYGLFLLVAGWLAGGFGGATAPGVVVPAIVLAVVVAAVVDVSLSPRLHRYLDRTVLGRHYDVRKALGIYSHQVSLILDLERLADVTLDWVRDTMRVERSAFILLALQEDGQAMLRVYRSRGFDAPRDQKFLAGSRFILHFCNVGRPLVQYDLDMLSWFQVARDEERQWLKALEVDLYVPILASGNPVALLALGPKEDGQPYSDEDTATLIALAGQTATAVENARLLDDLRAVQSDLHRLNSELAETNRQLQRLDKTKSDFVTIASHELRTPLSQIFGWSDVLEESLEGDGPSDSQELQTFIAGISRGAMRLKEVVDAMMDVSMLETGSLKLRITPVQIGGVIDRAVASVATGVQERGHAVTVGDLSGLPVIQADAARLEQVFSGLLSNAVKFMTNGGEISVTGLAASPLAGKGYVEILVADRGIGIDPEQRELIFEKFYRPESPLLHSTNATGFKGAGPGLGLSIARGLVQAHGGRIWAESPGRDENACPGSTFHVRLPLTQPDSE